MGHISTLHFGTCTWTFFNGTYFNTPCWNFYKKHSLMEHSSTLLDGIYDYLTCTLLNWSSASNAICCKIALKWLKSQKVKVPLRHPKKWWPPICTKIGPQIVESPKFHINTLLWTFFSQKAFKSEFESRVPFRSVKLDAHYASHFYNYESSIDVLLTLPTIKY